MAKFIPTVLQLPANKKGRDFVVGDIHGCLDQLTQKLDTVQFDKTKDRLFSVGDLIDRGPDSLGVLRLLVEPWFFAVRGNHEDLFLDYISKTGIYETNTFLYNGGDWLLKNASVYKESVALSSYVIRLPHVIVVGSTPDNRFNVVHAGLARFDGRKGAIVATDKDIDCWTEYKPGKTPLTEMDLIWERTLFAGTYGKLDPKRVGLSPTFCGHTIGQDIRVQSSHINLDTGAFRRYTHKKQNAQLTLVEASSFVAGTV